MICHPPSCFGTRPSPEVQKLGREGDSEGLNICPKSHCFQSGISNIRVQKLNCSLSRRTVVGQYLALWLAPQHLRPWVNVQFPRDKLNGWTHGRWVNASCGGRLLPTSRCWSRRLLSIGRHWSGRLLSTDRCWRRRRLLSTYRYWCSMVAKGTITRVVVVADSMGKVSEVLGMG